MILIDALYINNSGGKVLLDYLVTKLEQTDAEIFYLFDKRIEKNHIAIKRSNSCLFMKGSLWERNKFYLKHRNSFTTILCFASLPPTIRLQAKVYTYFQQVLYLNVPAGLSVFTKLLTILKSYIVRLIKKNSGYWIVQSDSVRNRLAYKFNISKEQILIIPFYPPLLAGKVNKKKLNKFLYVSDGSPHKNHERLLQAFSKFYNTYKSGELNLTVSFGNKYLCDKIENLRNSGIPVINHGLIPREKLTELYQDSEFLVYPSLAESFGLGIIEALENGCQIIGSDLPYIYSVCEPSIVFDPQSVNEIAKAFEKSLMREFKPSKQLLFNEIDRLLQLMISQNQLR